MVETAISVACLGAVAVSIDALSSSSSSAVLPSPAAWSDGGCGECQVIPIADEWFSWHAVILGAGESVSGVDGVYVFTFRKTSSSLI